MHLGFTQIRPLINRSALVAISPHLDDVALGCADLVAAYPGALVVTVTAGRPGPHELTDWDGKCGFGPDDDVMGARRLEDAAAIEWLGGRSLWLDFLDRHYDPDWESPDPARVADAIRPLINDAGVVASPLGLLHPDHIAIASACFQLARSLPSLPWILYEDAIYRATDGATEAAAAKLRASGLYLEPFAIAPAERKREAIDCYTSQLQGLGDLILDAYEPERYWTLVRTG
jgi:LmbE family N-acetylglucosaminyl deacetylase